MIKPGTHYRTRNGRPVRIFATDGGGSHPIIGAYRDPDGVWVPCSWQATGMRGERGSKLDLVELPCRPAPLQAYFANFTPLDDGRINVQPGARGAYSIEADEVDRLMHWLVHWKTWYNELPKE